MVQGKLPVPGRPTLWMIVGQGPIALAVGAGGGGLDIFTLLYLISSLSPSLWETARYRLKYCLKGPLNPKQPTDQSLVLGKCLQRSLQVSCFLQHVCLQTFDILRFYDEPSPDTRGETPLSTEQRICPSDSGHEHISSSSAPIVQRMLHR